MTHVATHCCGVGDVADPPELPEIPVTIHNRKLLNLAVALKRWPNETDDHFMKRDEKLMKLIEKMAELATPPGQPVDMYTYAPSYVHPEP